jgi:hypothetical protein
VCVCVCIDIYRTWDGELNSLEGHYAQKIVLLKVQLNDMAVRLTNLIEHKEVLVCCDTC